MAELIADAQQRVEEFSDRHAATVPAFVPSDFELVYRGLAGDSNRSGWPRGGGSSNGAAGSA